MKNEKLLAFLKQKKVSQKELAILLNTNESTISRAVNGKREWTLSEINQFSKCFGIKATCSIFFK